MLDLGHEEPLGQPRGGGRAEEPRARDGPVRGDEARDLRVGDVAEAVEGAVHAPERDGPLPRRLPRREEGLEHPVHEHPAPPRREAALVLGVRLEAEGVAGRST